MKIMHFIMMGKAAGKDIEKIDQILKGEIIKQEKFFSKSYATTSFLNG